MVNNFWSGCPRKLEHFPEASCPLGKLGSETKGDQNTACSWYINSPEDFFCFWKWARRRSDMLGCMEPLSQNEITELLGFSGSKINQTIKDSIEQLEKAPEFQDLKTLYLNS